MLAIATAIAGLGGLAATHELYALGFTRGTLRAAVYTGTIIRVRQGWYALPATEAEPYLRAARIGGRLTCVSQAAQLGLAVRNDAALHVAVPENAARLRDPQNHRKRLASRSGVRIHWTDDRVGSTDRFAMDTLSVLRQMAFCQSPERVVAAVDSALRLRLIDASSWQRAIASMPAMLAALLAEIDGRSESITESVTRFRLSRLKIRARCQVQVPGVGRVDLLIGARLVVEVDGFAYHSDRDRFENDRRRDARLSIRGYRVLRFSYNQVFNHWSEVRAAIEAAIARGDHR